MSAGAVAKVVGNWSGAVSGAVADVRREADGRTYHALVRFRAVTEPA